MRSSDHGLRPELNFRDLGGHVTADGATVRPGSVYRTAHLQDCDDDEVAAVARLGIRTVCDLRAPEEADAWPGLLASLDGVDVRRLGRIGGRAIGDPVDTILEYGFTQVTADDVANFYRLMIDQQPEVFAGVVDACARAEAHAVVIHCSHGKDRTGIAAALVLSLLGVADDDVIADYARTNDAWAPAQMARARPRLTEAGVDFDAVEAFFTAPPAALAATLDHLREGHGSIEGYLTGAGGLAPEAIDSLRDCLLIR